jgi:hypothetical protein
MVPGLATGYDPKDTAWSRRCLHASTAADGVEQASVAEGGNARLTLRGGRRPLRLEASSEDRQNPRADGGVAEVAILYRF